MAITTDDFNKIWASTSPLTPYSFSESQYKEGWNFIGSTPPSRQMWDFLQKNNDEKMQYLLNHFDNYLPLSGGTVSGTIKWSGNNLNVIKRDNGNDGLVIIGGDTDNFSGASLQLFGQTQANYAGQFYLRASTRSDGNDKSHPSVDLKGNPNGSLTWGNKEVERINTSGSNYIRYESGLQICWGILGAGTSFTLTYPVAFNTEPSIATSATSNITISIDASGRKTTGFVATLSAPAYMRYIAIGTWK